MGNQVPALYQENSSFEGRGCGQWTCSGWGMVGGVEILLCQWHKVTQWVEVCVSCQMSGSFCLASLYTPGSG